ncbi:MAG: hypothetical protein IPM55_14520 [Acidobacteria bacterium]|nr:hypothetical protein [Acidobacteriota bacterium]
MSPTVREILTIKDRIKRLQKRLGLVDDGIIGPATLTRIEAVLDKCENAPSAPPVPFNLECSKAGLEVIVKFEISSQAHYESKLNRPTWPGGESGVTIGIGYDLGFNTKTQIREDWRGRISDENLDRLAEASRVTGQNARALIAGLRDIKVPYEAAKEVFFIRSLVRFAKDTRGIYPGIEKLPADAQSMLLSLVFNRGTKLTGSTRVEMNQIVSLVKSKNLKGIADQIRSMKRLWVGKGLPGLLARRDIEANMVENARLVYPPEELVRL